MYKFQKKHLLFLCVVISVFLIILITYLCVQPIVIRQSIKTSSNALSAAVNVQDSFLLQADRTMKTLAKYPGISNSPAMFRRYSYLEHYHMFQYLERVAEENEMMDYIAVYYPEDQKVMVTNRGISDFEDFPGNMMPLYAGNENRLVSFFLIDPSGTPNEGAAISLVKNIPYGYAGNPRAIICLNISSSYFEMLFAFIIIPPKMIYHLTGGYPDRTPVKNILNSLPAFYRPYPLSAPTIIPFTKYF